MSWCQSGSAALRAGRSPHLLSGGIFSSAVQSPWVRGGFCGWHKAKASVPPVRQHGRIKGRSLCAGSPGVGRYRSGRPGVSDLSVPSDLPPGGLHSDPLAGICTLFHLSPHRDGAVCRERNGVQFNGWNVVLLIITQGRPFCNITPKNHLPENAGHCRGDPNPARQKKFPGQCPVRGMLRCDRLGFTRWRWCSSTPADRR